jgi:hypothetical protein
VIPSPILTHKEAIMKTGKWAVMWLVLMAGPMRADGQDEKTPKAETKTKAKGIFITTPGTQTLQGGKITLKIEEKNGKLDSYVTRNRLEGEPEQPGTWGPLNPRIKKDASWFIYTDSPDEVWWFDGDGHLYMIPYNNHQPDFQDGGVYQMGGKYLKIAPKELLDRLPKAFKEQPDDDESCFITAVGTYSLHGGKVTFKIEEKNDKLDTYVLGRRQEWGPINPRIMKNAKWFVYTGSADELWWYDGDRHLYLFPCGNHRPDYGDGSIFQISAKYLPGIAPKPVLDRLSKAFQEEIKLKSKEKNLPARNPESSKP